MAPTAGHHVRTECTIDMKVRIQGCDAPAWYIAMAVNFYRLFLKVTYSLIPTY